MITPRILTTSSVALAVSLACGSDGSIAGRAEQPGAKAVQLPPRTSAGKPAAELEAEGWKPVEVPPDLATRLRDSARAAPAAGRLALEPLLRAELQPPATSGFDSAFADTVRLIEQRLVGFATERLTQREAEIADSLKRAMEEEPDLDEVSLIRSMRRPATLIHHAAWSGTPRIPGLVYSRPQLQGTQTRSIQIAPGIVGTETTSSDGSTSTTEVGFKRGEVESTTRSTVTTSEEYEKTGEIGSKIDVTSSKRGKGNGTALEETEGRGHEQRLGYCPDASGLARGKYTSWLQGSSVTTVGTVTVNYEYEARSEFTLTVSVNDDARAEDAVAEGTSTVKISGGARGGGNATPGFKQFRGESRWQKEVHGDGMGNVHFRYPSTRDNDEKFTSWMMESLADAIYSATDLARQAEKRWQNGACVEVTTTPESKPLRYSGKAAFKVDVKHKREPAGNFPYPIRIMVQKWGTDPTQTGKIHGTLSPEGTVTAPVTFDYTAPAKGTPEAKLWTTSYPPIDGGFPMSISRRGIGGSTFSVPFDSGLTGWRIERHNRIEIAGKTIFVGRHDAVLRQLEEPLSDGSTHEGTGKFVGNAVAGVRHCLKHKSIPAQSLTKEMRATATATPVGQDSVDFAFSIVPAKEATTMDDAMFLMDQMVLATYPLGNFRGVKTFVDTIVPPSPCGEEVRQIVTHKFRRLR